MWMCAALNAAEWFIEKMTIIVNCFLNEETQLSCCNYLIAFFTTYNTTDCYYAPPPIDGGIMD